MEQPRSHQKALSCVRNCVACSRCGAKIAPTTVVVCSAVPASVISRDAIGSAASPSYAAGEICLLGMQQAADSMYASSSIVTPVRCRHSQDQE